MYTSFRGAVKSFLIYVPETVNSYLQDVPCHEQSFTTA